MQPIEPTMPDQASRLRQLKSNKPAQVIAVTAGKGGVGKTNISVNLAISLAKQGKKVILLDADFGLANIDVLLGIHAQKNISNVIEGECELKDVLIEGPCGIKIIPSSSGTQMLTQLSHLQHAGLIHAFSDLADDVDYLIVDTAAGISDGVISFTRSAHEVIVTVCDEPTSITDAYALIKVLSREHGIRNFHILPNMVQTAYESRELFAKLSRVTEQFLDVNLDHIGEIAFDNYLRKSVKQQKAVITAFPGSHCANDFKKLAQRVSQWPVNLECSGHSTFFLERLINHPIAESR